MKLLTQDILKKIPLLYSQENEPDPMVWVKFFTPDSSWSWLATEFSPEEGLFFGFVVSGIDPSLSELGYFSLSELEEATGPRGLHIERDMYFRPCPLSEAKAKEMGGSREASRGFRQREADAGDQLWTGGYEPDLGMTHDEATTSDGPFVLKDDGFGYTENSLEFFNEHADEFVEFIHAWFVYDKEAADYELHLQDRGGKEMVLSGFSFGYAGQGPYGTMEVLEKAGFPITTYLTDLVSGRESTPTRGELKLASVEKKGVKYDASDDLNNLMKLADQLGVAVGEPFDLLDQLNSSANAIFDRLYDTSPAQVKLMDMTSVGGNLGAAWKEAGLLMGEITDSLSTIQFRTSAAMRNYDWFREEQGKRYKRPGPEASKQSIDEWDPETRILKMGATTPEGGPEPGLGAAEAMTKQAEDDANEPLKSHGQPEGLVFDWTYDVDSYNYPAFEDDPEGDKEIYGRSFNNSDEFEDYLGFSPIDEIIKACKPGLYGGYTYDEHGLGTLGWQTPAMMILDMERLEGATDKNGYGLVNNDGMRWRVWLNGDTIDEGEGFMDKSEVIDYVKEYKADAYGNLPGDEDYNGVGQGRYSEDNLIEEGPESGPGAVEAMKEEAEKKVTVALPGGSFAEFPELWGRMTYPGETPQTCGDCGWEGEVEETQITNIDEDGQWDGQFSCPECGSGNLEYPDDAEWTQTAVLKAFDEGFLSFKERY